MAIVGSMGAISQPVNSQSANSPTDPLAGNPRLLQKVRILAEGAPVGDLLALISKETDADLAAHRDVADDKVILCGPAKPLRDLLSDIAALFNDTWLHTKSADGLDHYSLTRNRIAREYETALALDVRDRMKRQLEAFVARARSPEPYAYESYRVAAQLLGLLSDEQQNQLLQRRSLNLVFGNLAAPEQVTARQAVNALYDADAVAAQKNSAAYQRPPNSELEDSGVRFQIQSAAPEDSGKRLHLFLIIGAAYSEDFGALDDRIPWLLPSHGDPFTRKPIQQPTSIPTKGQIDSIIGDNWLPASIIGRLEALTAKSGVSIVADYYRSRPAPLPTVDPFPLEAADEARRSLDQFGKSQPILWWVHDETLLVRSRNWYTQRIYEVPDRWLLGLQKQIAQQHGLPAYRDVIKLTELTQSQLAGLHGRDSADNNIGILGAGTDENTLGGLLELLAIYKAQYGTNSKQLIQKLPASDEDLRRATITFDEIAPENRNLVTSFIQAQPNPVSVAAGGREFLTRLTRTAPEKNQPGAISLMWTMGQYQLMLPNFPVTDRGYKLEVALTK